MSILFHTSTSTTSNEIKFDDNAVLLHGDMLDERGRLAVNSWKETCTRIQTMYDVEKMSISIGDKTCNADSIVTLLKSLNTSKIVLEATTLGFPELFTIISGLLELGSKEINIVYVEPASYTRITPGAENFALSEMALGYQPIPRSVVDLSSDDLEAGVFFLGFEPERLDRALEEHQMISGKEVKVIFGIPAYHPGWELDSIIPHLPRLLQNSLEIDYCSANDPEAAFDCLEKTRAALSVGKRMFVAPIGPKPCGIATAIFASAYPDQVGLLFDHPRRSPKRTDGALVWHQYNISISNI